MEIVNAETTRDGKFLHDQLFVHAGAIRPAREVIFFGVKQSSLGHILVGFSMRGVVMIAIGPDPNHLIRGLHAHFPEASIIRNLREHNDLATRIVEFVECPASDLDFPLDLRGTQFQRKVWNELRRIPVGHTVTYPKLAERIGLPRAVRAVEVACLASPIAFAIPNHRVVIDSASVVRNWLWRDELQRLMVEREATLFKQQCELVAFE